jgi:pimeloyl-ACP methyl ester carboxylesterase
MSTRSCFLPVMCLLLFLALILFGAQTVSAAWDPPAKISKEEMIKVSRAVLAMPEISTKQTEDIFRIRAVDMDWDIGVMVYEPENPSKIPIGPDGKKAGIFLLHGGTGDYKSMDRHARMLSGKFGYRVVSMTFPGRLHLFDPSRDWPGDTLNADGSARTPLWSRDSKITPDQYRIVKDQSKRNLYGTIISLEAKEGTELYHRMAGWPAAFEGGVNEACRRHLPPDQYSIYIHGHSTGGPFAFMACQRVPNIVGIIGYGTSPFGYMYPATGKGTWDFPFTWLRMRTWADTARYLYEGIKDKGYGVAMMMELVFEDWDVDKKRANFKAEDFIHKNSTKSLADAARATAKRMNLDPTATEALVQLYVGYCRELSGPGVKPVPPFLSIHGGDDDTVSYEHLMKVMPLFEAMKPAPKVRGVLLAAGTHDWTIVDKDFPEGTIPVAVKLWNDAILGGYYVK